jgi:hypothetical protein
MCITPSAASAMNQTQVIGPKLTPTRAVPWRWIQNRATRMPSVIGTT